MLSAASLVTVCFVPRSSVTVLCLGFILCPHSFLFDVESVIVNVFVHAWIHCFAGVAFCYVVLMDDFLRCLILACIHICCYGVCCILSVHIFRYVYK